MKAFVYKLDDNGRTILPGRIIGPYANRRNLEHFGMKGFAPGTYRIESPYSWDRRFSQDMSRDFRIWNYTVFSQR